MSGIELGALEACVAAVVSAYKDGSTLVRRIKTRRYELKKPVAELQTERLEDSLRLGPPVVQGQYDHDFRRFGETYAQGDQIARDSMKDIIINLQMALITSLHEALQTDLELNYESLLIASDNTRTNAVVCLGQLHQRLASQPSPSQNVRSPSTQTQNLTPRQERQIEIAKDTYRSLSPQPPPPYPQSAHSSTEMSTGGGYNATPPVPISQNREADDRSSPTNKSKRSSSISSSLSFRRRFFPNHSKESEQRNGVDHEQHPINPVNEYRSEHDFRARQAPEAMGPRQIRSPSTTDPPSMLVSPVDQARGGSRAGFYSPDDVRNNNPWTPFPISPTSEHTTSRSNGGVFSSLNSPLSNDRQQQQQDQGSSSLIVASPPTRTLFHSSSNPRNNHGRGPSSTSGTSTTSSTNEGLTPFSSGNTGTVSKSPYMPSEENKFSGFCKGAWKMQNNMKGAMSAEHRPSGMYGEIRFWRCCKCRFDGPMYGGSSKASRKFDNQVRVDISGIRYRWIFLAKSHVPLKQVPNVSDGSGGSFGCIFCCAEWQQDAPVFKDLERFMEHLQRHREQVLSPELIYRTKCIVGRIAADTEDFEINLPPKAQEMG
ncbi:hypothetical protein FQN54_002709 [Arachnomyces sp. PD_36]|nr:hypothetical protein FQN54_002709 [Arachnomyces sp. PD_36]